MTEIVINSPQNDKKWPKIFIGENPRDSINEIDIFVDFQSGNEKSVIENSVGFYNNDRISITDWIGMGKTGSH